MQPQSEIDPIFDEFAFEYTTAGAIDSQDRLDRTNEVCRVKGRAGVALLTDLDVTARRYGLPGLTQDVDSGRWIENDITTPAGNLLTVVCVYVHAGNTDDPVKMEQKYRFLDTMLNRMGELRDEAADGGRQAYCAAISTSHTRRPTSRTPKPTRSMPASCPRSVPTWTVGWGSTVLWT